MNPFKRIKELEDRVKQLEEWVKWANNQFPTPSPNLAGNPPPPATHR